MEALKRLYDNTPVSSIREAPMQTPIIGDFESSLGLNNGNDLNTNFSNP
jgi:hypothetical protein